MPHSIWITGSTRTGKTTELINQFCLWFRRKTNIPKQVSLESKSSPQSTSAILVFAANDDNRRELADRLSMAVGGIYPVSCKTPLGFISDEVELFWPLLFEQLHLKAQFPLRLRPETEQELATRLWHPVLAEHFLAQTGVSEYRLVRRTLDLLQLAGASGIATEDIPHILEQGLDQVVVEGQFPTSVRQELMTDSLPSEDLPVSPENQTQLLGNLLLQWRQWCLERGLLTYGIIYELYWRYLLPNPKYQSYLSSRYQAIFADDVDDYPAIAKDLFDFLLQQGAFAVFTYNPDGQVRLGLSADPNYLALLAARSEVVELPMRRVFSTELAQTAMNIISDPLFSVTLPEQIQSLQTITRAEILRKTAEVIISAVKQGRVEPAEIAIIAPGLDEIARYTLLEILSSAGVAIQPLNEQRSLISSPLVRALLTLLGLVYQGLGRLVLRDDVAEMLVILSRQPQEGKLVPQIDPVRGGLIADYCYHIDPEKPVLLAVEKFPRWDRLGYQATEAYKSIIKWIEETKNNQQQQKFYNPMIVLDEAIKHFVGNGTYLPYGELSALRELMETAQHFWEIDRRLRQHETSTESPTTTLSHFITLLRRGTITANPRPITYIAKKPNAVILATIFQYRSLRSFHRWQFWLDAGSNLWDKGGAAILFAAPLFLREWDGRELTPEDEIETNQARLRRILRDLFARVGERIFLCHSDLGVSGTEQGGPLLPLVYACQEFTGWADDKITT